MSTTLRIMTVQSDMQSQLVRNTDIIVQLTGFIHQIAKGYPAAAIVQPNFSANQYTVMWRYPGDFNVYQGCITIPDIDSHKPLRETYETETHIGPYLGVLDLLFSHALTDMDETTVIYLQLQCKPTGETQVYDCFLMTEGVAMTLFQTGTSISNPGPEVRFNSFLMGIWEVVRRQAMASQESISMHLVMAIFGILFAAVFGAYVIFMGTSIIPRLANALQSIPWFANVDYRILYLTGLLFSVTDTFVFMSSGNRSLTVVGWVSQGIGGLFHVWYGITNAWGSSVEDVILSGIFSVSVAFGGELALIFLFLLVSSLFPTIITLPWHVVSSIRSEQQWKKRQHTIRNGAYTYTVNREG